MRSEWRREVGERVHADGRFCDVAEGGMATEWRGERADFGGGG